MLMSFICVHQRKKKEKKILQKYAYKCVFFHNLFIILFKNQQKVKKTLINP